MSALTDAAVRAAVEPFPLHTRMRWAAELNSWQIPGDFPVAAPDLGDDHEAQYRDPTWRAIANGTSNTLTHAQWSLGWWVYALNRTPDAWAEWWVGRGLSDSAETVHAYEASVRYATTGETA